MQGKILEYMGFVYVIGPATMVLRNRVRVGNCLDFTASY